MNGPVWVALEVSRTATRSPSAMMSSIVILGSDRPAEAGTEAVQAIGRALEAHYADLVHAPLPDKFLQLLARLEDDKSALKAEGKRDALD